MSLFATYATKTDLAAYLVVNENTLPADIQRYLNRANELIGSLIKDNINYGGLITSTESTERLEAAKLAVCAQVEYWLEMGESISMVNGIKTISIGSFSASFDDSKQSLSQRAKMYLNTKNLLYKGVRNICGSQDSY